MQSDRWVLTLAPGQGHRRGSQCQHRNWDRHHPELSYLKRSHPKDLRKLLVPDRLFEDRTLTDMEVLLETVERAILKGTTHETVHDTSPENVSATYWTRNERNSQPKDLYLALLVLHDLRDRRRVLQDRLAARTVLERTNADI